MHSGDCEAGWLVCFCVSSPILRMVNKKRSTQFFIFLSDGCELT